MTVNSDIEIPIFKWSPTAPSEQVEAFLRRPAIDPEAEKVARNVLGEIERGGDLALAACIERYDGASISPSTWLVSQEERKAARRTVDEAFKSAADEAKRRIRAFSQAGLRKDWTMATSKGGTLGERFQPLDRVGAYIPGGASPLVSTALMTITLARVAGVPEIVACSPANKDGELNPYVLFAMDLAGAAEIYKIGGIQAIGAMAYGTETISKVQKIVGPGGPYVTAAKRLVYGVVDLDMVAGPSEVAVLADATANPAYIAADLLSQAEHGTGHEKAILVTTAESMAVAVRKEILKQTSSLPRRKMIEKVLRNGTCLVVVDHLDMGMDLCNRFAPEHLELLVPEPRKWAQKVKRAGAVFVGNWTPECAGDFMAGPSHVLPTGGTAAMFSGLTVDHFRRRTSIVALTRADLQDVLPGIEAFGRVEELEAHARSARIRFE